MHPTALTIAGSDSGGGAGIQADLKTFLACRVHGTSAITAVTVQNSLGVSAIYELPPQAVTEQIESVVSDIGVQAAKTGMLANAPIIEAVADAIARLGIRPLVVDPVCASQRGNPLLDPTAVGTFIERILPLATIVTPNVHETQLLTGVLVDSDDTAQEAAQILHGLGAANVLIKGGHRDGPVARDVFFDGAQFIALESARRSSEHDHGTGDTLASATCAALAYGLDVLEALHWGKAYVTSAIDDGYPLGQGTGPVGHFWRINDLPEPFKD